MSEGAIFLNSGPLFSAERLETLEETPEWGNDEQVRAAYDRIRESFEKHATLLAGNPSVEETRFYMVNPTLHALGYTYSVYEPITLGGDRSIRVDYVNFSNSAEFEEAVSARGTHGFFRPSLNLVKAVAWSQRLQLDADGPQTDEEGNAMDPGLDVDLMLRSTGRDYGILTNGCDWRIYHHGTSALLNTFFQADMIAAIKSDFEDFKRFHILFRRDSFLKDDSGTSFIDRLLQ